MGLVSANVPSLGAVFSSDCLQFSRSKGQLRVSQVPLTFVLCTPDPSRFNPWLLMQTPILCSQVTLAPRGV
jgi:hypothetical protein